MKIQARPVIGSEFTPLVALKVGSQTAELTATQAEDLGQTLQRAATAARYESGVAEYLQKYGFDAPKALAEIREFIEARRVTRN